MQRRSFFKTLGSNLALLLLPKWGRAQATQAVTYQELAVVVLPESLGPKRIAETTAAFEEWLQGYKAGADMGYGYGYTKPTVSGPYPARGYPEQLKQLASAAAAKGGAFGSLRMQDRRAIVQTALKQAGGTTIPHRPNGKHVATDLMAYFYHSSDGVDFCYNAAIREKDCRGLASSVKRPAPVV
jgi:hypothetical protein